MNYAPSKIFVVYLGVALVATVLIFLKFHYNPSSSLFSSNTLFTDKDNNVSIVYPETIGEMVKDSTASSVKTTYLIPGKYRVEYYIAVGSRPVTKAGFIQCATVSIEELAAIKGLSSSCYTINSKSKNNYISRIVQGQSGGGLYGLPHDYLFGQLLDKPNSQTYSTVMEVNSLEVYSPGKESNPSRQRQEIAQLLIGMH